MKKAIVIFLAIISLTACGNNKKENTTALNDTQQKEYVEIIYFHGKQRCITCNAIEKLTKEVINNDFSSQLKQGTVVFKVIDISTEEGEQVADAYEVTWSSLFINQWKKGKESRNNLTEFGFTSAKDAPDQFKTGIKKKIDELLN